MTISNKAEHDPVTDLTLVDIYMRWALQAAEEVVGKQGLSSEVADGQGVRD